MCAERKRWLSVDSSIKRITNHKKSRDFAPTSVKDQGEDICRRKFIMYES